MVAASLLVAEVSQGQPSALLPNLQLDWPSIEGCPGGEEIRHAVAQHLGPAMVHASPVSATAVIERASVFRLVLSTVSSAGPGTRELSGDTCDSVADAAVVILAIMLGGEGAEPIREQAEPASAVIEPPRIAQPKVGQPPRNSVVSLRRLRFGQRSSARGSHSTPDSAVALGLYLPIFVARTPLPGAMASGSVEVSGWRVAAQFGWVPERKLSLSDDSTRGAKVTLGSVAISVGPVVRRGRWDLVPRIGFSELAAHGTGYGVDVYLSRWIYFPSARFGAQGTMQLTSQLFLTAMVDLAVPLRRPRLLIEPNREILRPAYLVLDAALGLGLRF